MTATPPSPNAPRLTPVADHALLIEFAEVIDPAAHAAVRHLDRALTAAAAPGLIELVPAYVSLLVDFDPMLTDHRRMAEAVTAALRQPRVSESHGQVQEVAVCYDTDLAPDLAEVATRCGLSEEAVIAAHLGGDYRVFMYGFAPGYAYLAGVPEALRLDRKPAPRRGVAAGSVLIAGPQCLVSTLTMPTGWWIIGRSPTRILTGRADRPFLFDVGDAVRFRRVDRATFERLSQEGGNG